MKIEPGYWQTYTKNEPLLFCIIHFFLCLFFPAIFMIFFSTYFQKYLNIFSSPPPYHTKKRNDTYIIITVGFLQVRKSVANFLPKILFECVVFAYSPGFTRLLLQKTQETAVKIIMIEVMMVWQLSKIYSRYCLEDLFILLKIQFLDSVWDDYDFILIASLYEGGEVSESILGALGKWWVRSTCNWRWSLGNCKEESSAVRTVSDLFCWLLWAKQEQQQPLKNAKTQ